MKHPIQQAIQLMENEMGKHNFYQAEMEANRFMKIFPSHPFGYLIKGSLLLKKENDQPPKKAQELLYQALFLCYQKNQFHQYLGIVYNELGIYYRKLNRFERALTCYYQSLATLSPNEYRRISLIHFNLATTYLTMGNLEMGFPEYKWVYIDRDDLYRYFEQPYWQGEAHPDKTLLIHNEQAYGDLIFFLRCLPLIKNRFKKIYLEVTPRLIRLVKSSPLLLSDPSDLNSPLDPTYQIIPRPGDRTGQEQKKDPRTMTPPHPPEIVFHYHTNYALLPYYGQISMETIPAPLPYLQAEPFYRQRWQQFLAPFKNTFKVGLNWCGKPTNSKEHLRQVPLTEMLRLADIPGVQLFSVQKFVGLDQVKPGQPMINLDKILDRDLDNAFLDTAALMMELDLIITSDTSTAHIAGCLNRPVWILLHKANEWRWFLDRTDSPWYPEVARLFRQKKSTDWPTVLTEVHQALEEQVSNTDWVTSDRLSQVASPQSFQHRFMLELESEGTGKTVFPLTSESQKTTSNNPFTIDPIDDLDGLITQTQSNQSQMIISRIPDVNRIIPDYTFNDPSGRNNACSNILATTSSALAATPIPSKYVSDQDILQPIQEPSGPINRHQTLPRVPIKNPAWSGPYWDTSLMVDPGLLEQYQQIHQRGVYDGEARFVPQIEKILQTTHSKTMLDFGSGKGKQYYRDQIHKNWGVELTLYDPSVPDINRLPDRQYDFVFCVEVLEHLTEMILDPVLEYLFGHCQKALFLTVSVTKAIKNLPDGRNAHTLLKSVEWWQDKLQFYQQKYRLKERNIYFTSHMSQPQFTGEVIVNADTLSD